LAMSAVDSDLGAYSTAKTNSTSSLPAERHSLSLSSLRTAKEDEIMSRIPNKSLATYSLWHRFRELPSWVLVFLGILSFGKGSLSTCYASFVLLVIVSIVLLSGHLAVTDSSNALSTHLCTMCYALGALLGLCCLRANRVQSLLGPGMPFELYARSRGCRDAWLDNSTQHFLLILMVWLVAGLARVLTSIDSVVGYGWDASEDGGLEWISLLCFLLSCGIFGMLSFSLLHVCLGLEAMIDDFSISFFMEVNVEQALFQWNILQALLRRTARVVESCVLSLQTSVLVTLVLTGVEALDDKGPLARGSYSALLWSVSIAVPVIISLYVLLRAAAVTEKCSRLPSLVNSIAIDNQEKELDRACLDLVKYVNNSAAGFYVKGVRLTTFMVLKLVYVLGLATLSLIFRTVGKS